MKKALGLLLLVAGFIYCSTPRAVAQVPPAHTAAQQPIIFVNPSGGAATVHVKEYEVKVGVPDPIIKSLFISVYRAGAAKPYIARRLQLERGDTEATEIVALVEGANRIVVEDAATMGEADPSKKKLAEVVLTYEPPQRAVLGQVGAVSDGFVAGDTVICGQLQLASLNQTLALIKATPELSDLAMRFRDPGDQLVSSTRGDACGALGGHDGAQKIAVVDVLRATLYRLEDDLSAKDDLQINQAVRTQSIQDLLTRTSAPPPRVNAAQGTESNDALSAQRARLATAVSADAQTLSKDKDTLNVTRGTEFSNLSVDTIRKQIVLLEQFLGNVSVQLKDKDGKVIHRVRADRDGTFIFILKNADGTAANDNNALPNPRPTPPLAHEYSVSTEGDQYFTSATVVALPGSRQRVNILIQDRPVSLLARALVGYDQAGAAASKSEQTFFFNLYLSKTFPLVQKIHPDFGERLRTWGDFRINSVPQTGDQTVKAFATGGFATQVSGLTLKEVARVFEFLGGFEYRLTGNNALLPSFDRQTRQKFALSLIGGFGSVTPLDSQQGIAFFKVFDDAPGLPAGARGKEFVAFTRTDRDSFFRQYYVGFRLNTFFFNNYNIPMQRFPAQLDVMIGQNEFVTGGKLAGPVLRFDGFFPLPYEDYKWINLYASAIMRPGGARTSEPLILQGAPADTPFPAANVALFAVPQPNRDHYRIGFGVDFLSLFNKIMTTTTTPGQ